ncbi:MAG: 16S rRNA processing protein RimM, partial [Bauldia sp.]|nr:16S rRNA processing protein RimM [Bauldia sp.]
MAAGRSQSRVCLGVITGARGLKGEVRVKSFTARPEDVGAYGPLTDEAETRTLILTVTA